MDRAMINQLDELLATFNTYRGQEVGIVESLSRSRDVGHDRHFSTRSEFFMRLRDVGVAFSGATLMIDGEAGGRAVGYQVALDAVTSADIEPHAIVIVGQFEQRTERRSQFTVCK
jgi:hypothetical protein